MNALVQTAVGGVLVTIVVGLFVMAYRTPTRFTKLRLRLLLVTLSLTMATFIWSTATIFTAKPMIPFVEVDRLDESVDAAGRIAPFWVLVATMTLNLYVWGLPHLVTAFHVVMGRPKPATEGRLKTGHLKESSCPDHAGHGEPTQDGRSTCDTRVAGTWPRLKGPATASSGELIGMQNRPRRPPGPAAAVAKPIGN